MKKLIIIFTLAISFNKSNGQTYDEWFRQKKTQTKYLLQQIAALQVYIGYAAKGYSIATKGLNTIQNIKHGDFNLHRNYFNSLYNVNPDIREYSKVADIISMQISIEKLVHKTIKDCRSANQLTSTELIYLQQVFNNLLNGCAKSLDELYNLITDGEVQMKDDERIKRIDMLHSDMQDKKVFAQSFSHSAKGLSIQRSSDQYDIQIEQKINGLRQ